MKILHKIVIYGQANTQVKLNFYRKPQQPSLEPMDFFSYCQSDQPFTKFQAVCVWGGGVRGGQEGGGGGGSGVMSYF